MPSAGLAVAPLGDPIPFGDIAQWRPFEATVATLKTYRSFIYAINRPFGEAWDFPANRRCALERPVKPKPAIQGAAQAVSPMTGFGDDPERRL